MARAEVLWPYVEDTLRETLGERMEMVGERVVSVQHGSSRVLIRLLDDDEPRLQVFSPVLQGVAKSPELLEALNDLDAALAYAKIFWIEDDVMLATELLAGSLDKASITNAIQVVANAADHFDDELKSKFGGETSFPASEPEGSDAETDEESGAKAPRPHGLPEGVSLPPGMEQGEGKAQPPSQENAPDERPAAAGSKPRREDDAPGYL